MQEHQVTVARQRFPLDAPFFVLATQNPLEMEGTYPLPEAQLDRFLFKVMVPFPSEEDLIAIMDRTTGAESVTASKVCTAAEIVEMQRLARAVPIAPHVTAYAVSVLAATHPDQPRAPGLVREYVRYGGSPRGAQALVTAGKIYALLDGRFNVSIDDIRAVALPSLRHRIILNFEGEAEGITTEAVVRTILDAVVAADRRVAPAAAAATERWTARARPRAPRRPDAPGRPARARRSCPSEVDPTVFDEAFLRQLERLLLLMRSPVRGGLKGGRRSVKRGQSVEFADYRDYTLGDDLRQLDWNVYARLERLFVKLFIEEEDVTVTLLVDASASMAAGHAGEAPLRQAGGGGPRLHRARAARTGSRSARWPGGSPGAGPRCAAPGGSSGCWPTCRRSSRPTARPTSSPPPATPPPSSTAAASSILLSDLLDPAADRVIRELAATGSELDRPARPRRPTSSTRRSRATSGSSTSRPASGST